MSSASESQLRRPMTMSIERTSRQRKGIPNDSNQLPSELVGAVKGDGKEDYSSTAKAIRQGRETDGEVRSED